VKRHVFPHLVLTLVCLLATFGAVRAQDSGGADGDEPRPAEKAGDEEAADETSDDAADDAAQPAAEGAGDGAAPPGPPAVGDPVPERLFLRALPRPGADPAADDPEQPDPGMPTATLAGETPRPVVLVFWSSRCPVCKRYAEVLQKLAGALGDRAAVVLVASGADETPENVRQVKDEAKLRLRVLLDTESKAAKALGVRVTPTALLLDAEGVLRYRGPIDDDRRARSRDARELLRPAVEAVLAGKPVENGDIRPFGSALR